MELIDKASLVAELKKRISDYWSDSENTMGIYPYALEEVIKYVNTLEVKEVDLEKEIEEHVESMPMSEFTHESEVDAHWDWARKEFRHFFELGLKVQKGEYLGH